MAARGRKARGRDGPELLGEILGRGPTRRPGIEARASAKWAEIAGAEIASRTAVTSFRRNVLRVRVDSSVLLAELDGIYKKDLIAAMAEGTHPLPVRTIEFELRGAAAGP